MNWKEEEKFQCLSDVKQMLCSLVRDVFVLNSVSLNERVLAIMERVEQGCALRLKRNRVSTTDDDMDELTDRVRSLVSSTDFSNQESVVIEITEQMGTLTVSHSSIVSSIRTKCQKQDHCESPSCM